MKAIFIGIAACFAHVVLVLFHLVASVLYLPFPALRRVNLACAKVSALVLLNWARGRGDEWRFHHRDYASAILLLPTERYQQFGRWMLFDDIVGYDSFGVIDRRRNVFVQSRDGALRLSSIPAEHWPADAATPEMVTKPPDGCLKLVSGGIHPSDNHFVRRRQEFDSALVPFAKKSELLAETATQSSRLILDVARELENHGIAFPIDLAVLAWDAAGAGAKNANPAGPATIISIAPIAAPVSAGP